MKLTALFFALVALAGCDRQAPRPAPTAGNNEPRLELKLDVDKGAIGIKKEGGSGGDSVDIEVKTK